jgi:glycosyltransferase involved in cell wall biosynthesis
MKLQILIPTFNCAQYIGQAIASVLEQSFQDFTILVVDNDSTDNTRSVVESFSDERIVYKKNARNVGAIPNHNICLDLASGSYIKFLSADDVLMPEVLRSQVEALDAMLDVGLVTSNCIVTDVDLNPLRVTEYLPGYRRGDLAIKECARKASNLVGAPSNMMIRHSVLNGLRMNPNLKWVGDLEFACKILERSNYYNIDRSGFCYRTHSGSDSAVGCPLPTRISDELRFINLYKGGVGSYARVLARAVKNAILSK